MNNRAEYKPLGEILQEADLLSTAQVEVALREQLFRQDLQFGQILALHGWVKQETADFFVEAWPTLIQNPGYHPIGYYLYSAGLLNKKQIAMILREQKNRQLRFGNLAVVNGWLKPTTVDFFLEHLCREEDLSSLCFTYLADSFEEELEALAKLDIIQTTEDQITVPANIKIAWTEEDVSTLNSLNYKISWSD